MSSKELREKLVAAPYAWPGGYPMYAITDDGAALCKVCCTTEADCIDNGHPADGWQILALDVNWEDEDMTCDHCGESIECAYDSGRDDVEVVADKDYPPITTIIGGEVISELGRLL